MKRRLILLFVFLCSLNLWADYDIVNGNYCYDFTDDGQSVIFRSLTNKSSYKGSFSIPSTVTYKGRTYSVTSIGNYAFRGCTGLTSITIPNSVTSIGWGAFNGCTGLTSITIPNSVTDIDAWAFEDCDNVKELIYAEGCTTALKTGLRNITSVTIPNSVTRIGSSAFEGCTGLTSITIPNSVTSIGSIAFYGCTGLTSITIPNSVTRIGNDAFSGCSGLTSITIPNSVTSIEWGAFVDCTGLTSITIPNSVTSIGYHAFSGCTGLTSITIPSSVTEIGSNPVAGCSGLRSITVDRNNTAYKSPNNNCLIEIATNKLIFTLGSDIPNGITKIGVDCFYSRSDMTSITIPNSVTSIDGGAFENCTGLTSIAIPNSVTRIGNRAFTACSSLTSITIPNSVTSIESNAFEDCTGLTSITIPNSVTSIGMSAFSGCTGLTSITIPNSVTSIGNYAFSNCTGLTSIKIPNSVTSIGMYAFSGCTGLTSITIPNSVISTGYHTFRDCTGLTSITIPNSVTSIDGGAFENCTGLTSIAIPNSVTSIGNDAFSGCTGLTSITIPNSVTSIGNSAFYGCTGLSSITIPNSVTSIESSAFSGCTGLTSITIPNSVTSIGSSAFQNVAPDTIIIRKRIPLDFSYNNFPFWSANFNKCVLVVPSGTKNRYTSSIWRQFSHIIEREFGTKIDSLTYEIVQNKAIITACATGYMGALDIPDAITIDNVTYQIAAIDNAAFSGCTKITSISYPNSVTSIGDDAFNDCYGLTTLTLPDSLTSIGDNTFRDCTGLTSITFPDSVTSIGSNAFYGCTGLTSITIPGSVSSVQNNSFSGCDNVTQLIYKEGCTEVHNIGLDSITSVSLPNTLASIASNTFLWCTKLKSITVPDLVKTIGTNAFPSQAKVYARRGGYSLISLWNADYTPYLSGTSTLLSPPSIYRKSATQTTLTINITNNYEEYNCYYNDNLVGDSLIITDLNPQTTYKSEIKLCLGADQDVFYPMTGNYVTDSLGLSFTSEVSPTTLLASLSYDNGGDAVVKSLAVSMNSVNWIESDALSATGLDPETTYILYGKATLDNGTEITTEAEISTGALEFTMQNPKIIQDGEAVVAAITTLSEQEENVGFEWRRTDWPDDFQSNSAKGVVYNGLVEGDIKNINSSYLWRCRPYYQSNSGVYYYGEWVGFDPSNTSYFEPTVYTYKESTVEENTAQVKAYIQRGTYKIKNQGIVYWKISDGLGDISSIPDNAITVKGSGTLMEVKLKGLDWNTDYAFCAFATTNEDETFYGEHSTFVTGKNPYPVDTIILKTYQLELTPGQTYSEQTTRVLPDKAVQVLNIYSTNETVATISPAGYITAVGIGEADIVYASTDSSGVSSRCHVIVKDPVGIHGIYAEESDTIDAIFDASGCRLRQMCKGVNIIRYKDGRTRKIIVK